MSFMPRFDRAPTERERTFLLALAAGVQRPAVSGPAARMCKELGWAEALFLSPDGQMVARSAIKLADIALVKAGYRAIGYVLTPRGRQVISTELSA